jgi:hypothetical protein
MNPNHACHLLCHLFAFVHDCRDLYVTDSCRTPRRYNGEAESNTALVVCRAMSPILVGFSTALVYFLRSREQRGSAACVRLICWFDVWPRSSRHRPRQKWLPLRDIGTPVQISIRILYNFFLSIIIASTVQILLAIVSTVLVLSQNFRRQKIQTNSVFYRTQERISGVLCKP